MSEINEIKVINESGEKFELLSELKNILPAVTRVLGREVSSLTLVFISAQKIKELNKRYRQKDSSTNILSFDDLREIFIALDIVKEEAEKYKISFEERLVYLVIHGILHLERVHHDNEEKYEKMEEIEDKIMKKLGYKINSSIY